MTLAGSETPFRNRAPMYRPASLSSSAVHRVLTRTPDDGLLEDTVLAVTVMLNGSPRRDRLTVLGETETESSISAYGFEVMVELVCEVWEYEVHMEKSCLVEDEKGWC